MGRRDLHPQSLQCLSASRDWFRIADASPTAWAQGDQKFQQFGDERATDTRHNTRLKIWSVHSGGPHPEATKNLKFSLWNESDRPHIDYSIIKRTWYSEMFHAHVPVYRG